MRDGDVGMGGRRETRMGNFFAWFSTKPVSGGADITITPSRGMVIVPEVDVETGAVTIRVRKEVGPKVGRQVKLCGRLIEVAERRYDHAGRLMLRDMMTGAWEPWRS